MTMHDAVELAERNVALLARAESAERERDQLAQAWASRGREHDFLRSENDKLAASAEAAEKVLSETVRDRSSALMRLKEVKDEVKPLVDALKIARGAIGWESLDNPKVMDPIDNALAHAKSKGWL